MSQAYHWAPPKPSRAQKAIPRRGRNHFSVFMTIGDRSGVGGHSSGCGSLGEYHTRIIALAEPDTIDVIEQVGPFPYVDRENVRHGHYLDQLVVKADGRRLAMSDKPYARVKDEFCEELEQVRNFGVENGSFDELYLVTEYARDPIDLHNAALIRGCRDVDEDVDLRAEKVVADMVGKQTMQTLTDLIDFGPQGFRALVRLIRTGRIRLVNKEKIAFSSLVQRHEKAVAE
ncbi:MAG: hypothetical protein CFE32_05675 [Alphaproteobacteria bacterium PA3]|nr:MAG: hypothetical protein CFE32_05675 [Alphaproteobacteria bacterium PA3]